MEQDEPMEESSPASQGCSYRFSRLAFLFFVKQSLVEKLIYACVYCYGEYLSALDAIFDSCEVYQERPF
jgi:hypothetical protein